MKPLNPWQSYRQIATRTAPPGQVILMLYEGALRFLDQAQKGFSLDDPCESITSINNNIIRAQQIIRELAGCLNLEEGGTLATELQRLYDYFDQRLQESNIKKDSAGIADVIRLLTELQEAWATMLNERETIPFGQASPVLSEMAA